MESEQVLRAEIKIFLSLVRNWTINNDSVIMRDPSV